jgi:hypothetical protein
MEAHAFRDAVHAEGLNHFRESGSGSTLTIEGNLAIDGRKLPIPRLFAATAASAAERFLIAMIKPNLTEVAQGLARYLESQNKPA